MKPGYDLDRLQKAELDRRHKNELSFGCKAGKHASVGTGRLTGEMKHRLKWLVPSSKQAWRNEAAHVKAIASSTGKPAQTMLAQQRGETSAR